MKKQIKLVMAAFAVMLVGVTSAFAYSVNDLGNAASDGDINKVKTIVNSGVDVNGRGTGSGGPTALFLAARNNKTTVMKYLISKGASVDRPNSNGNCPIHTAAYRGHLEAVKILVYNDCDVNRTDNDGNTALKYAQDEGHTQIVNFLKEYANKPASGSSSSSSSSTAKADVNAFVNAANKGDLATVKKQIELGVDINAYNSNGWTALIQAAYHGHTEIVKYLISKGANLNKQQKDSKDGKYYGTALFYAARNGHLDCVKALVEAKADINAKSATGSTPLAVATKNGKTEVVEYLKSKGAK